MPAHHRRGAGLLAPVSAIPLGSSQTIARWFNIDAFNRRSTDALASNLITLSSRFSGVRGPAVDVWNMSGTKNFSLPERFRLQFRAEF